DLIAQEAGGSPFFIDELVRYLRTGSELIKTVNTENGNKDNIGLIDLTANLDKMITNRFASLPEPARQLLEVIVVSGQPILRAVAKQAARLESEEMSAISYLRTQNLIRVIEVNEQTVLEIYHDRIRATINNYLPTERLTQLHNRLGLALEAIEGIDAE